MKHPLGNVYPSHFTLQICRGFTAAIRGWVEVGSGADLRRGMLLSLLTSVVLVILRVVTNKEDPAEVVLLPSSTELLKSEYSIFKHLFLI